MELPNSYFMAYPQRAPGTSGRENYKPDSGRLERGIQDAPRHAAAWKHPLRHRNFCEVSQTLTRACVLPGDIGHVHTCSHSCLNYSLGPGQDSRGSWAGCLTFPQAHLPACCVGHPHGYFTLHTWISLVPGLGAAERLSTYSLLRVRAGTGTTKLPLPRRPWSICAWPQLPSTFRSPWGKMWQEHDGEGEARHRDKRAEENLSWRGRGRQ